MDILIADVSGYQGNDVDFAAMAAWGVRGVYVEARQGNDRDNSCFDAQVAGAKAAGLAVGAYLLAYPLPESGQHPGRAPVDQVHAFWEACSSLGSEAGSLPPMLDCEWPVEAEWGAWGCTQASVASWIESAAQMVDQQWGRPCGIYCDPDWWGALGGAGRLPCFGQRRLWQAEYTVGGDLVKPASAVPKAPAPWGGASIWQFTDKLAIPGSRCVADGSVLIGGEAEWAALLAR